MEILEQRLEIAIKSALDNGQYTEATELAKALATIHNSKNIERMLNIYTELGEALKQVAKGFNPEMLMQLKNQGK